VTPEPADKSDAILPAFPGPLTLYPSRRKLLLVLLVCGVFAVGGFGMVTQAAPGGWFVLVVFALGTIIAAVALLPGAASLKLDRDGFQTTSLFRRRRTLWQDVTGFEPASIPPSMLKLVVYDDVNAAGRAVAGLNAAIAGRNAGLPDTYGLSAADLARLMTRWREQALASPPCA
jgi:hypothetical protein